MPVRLHRVCLRGPALLLLALDAAKLYTDFEAEHGSGDKTKCPAGSDVFTLSADSLRGETQEDSFTRVVLADYPSTGSTWVKKLLAAVSSGADCGSPACDIYGEAPCQVEDGLNCPCDWTPKAGSAIFKTHFPAQEVYKGQPMEDDQYRHSMRFDKIVQLLRHPVATIHSNIARWGGSAESLADSLYCWGEWWRRAAQAAGESNVLKLHYEDLCLKTAASIKQVAGFLGGCYSNISLDTIQARLAADPGLACIHADEISGLSKPSAGQYDEAIASAVGENMMQEWGYSLDNLGGSSELQTNVSYKSARAHRSARLPGTAKARNPWLSVW